MENHYVKKWYKLILVKYTDCNAVGFCLIDLADIIDKSIFIDFPKIHIRSENIN